MILAYFIGCIVSYFVSRAILNGKKTIGNVLTSIIIGLFSWLGLVWLCITWLAYKTLSTEKEF